MPTTMRKSGATKQAHDLCVSFVTVTPDRRGRIAQSHRRPMGELASGKLVNAAWWGARSGSLGRPEPLVALTKVYLASLGCWQPVRPPRETLAARLTGRQRRAG